MNVHDVSVEEVPPPPTTAEEVRLHRAERAASGKAASPSSLSCATTEFSLDQQQSRRRPSQQQQQQSSPSLGRVYTETRLHRLSSLLLAPSLVEAVEAIAADARPAPIRIGRGSQRRQSFIRHASSSAASPRGSGGDVELGEAGKSPPPSPCAPLGICDADGSCAISSARTSCAGGSPVGASPPYSGARTASGAVAAPLALCR